MKNLKQSFLYCVLVVFAIITIACTQKKSEAQSHAPAENVATAAQTVLTVSSKDEEPPATEPSAIDFNKYLDFKPMYTWSSIKFWGWSRDGKVAYSDRKYIDGRGGAVTTAVIFDIIDDVVLWKNSLDTEDYYDYEDNKLYDDAYNNFIAGFRKTCEQNKIEFLQVEFQNLPVRHNNQTVNIKVEKKLKTGDDWDEEMISTFGEIGSYRIIAENQSRTKIVHENSFGMAAVDVVACGYLVSPFENRVLIVIGEYIRVFEGWEINYTFVGCHLSNGF